MLSSLTGAWYPRERARLGSPCTIVMYHAVSTLSDPLAIAPATFLRHITLIAERYRVVPLYSLCRSFATGSWNERTVCLTFDDAYVDFLEEAFPVLMERRLHSTVFVPAGRIGQHNDWDSSTGTPRRRILSARQLRDLHATGLVEIGSHAMDHKRLTSLSDSGAAAQARDSRRQLEAVLGSPVRCFAYPYGQPGDYSPRTERALIDAGYDIAVSTHWGTRHNAEDRMHLKRVWFTQQDSDADVLAKIEGAYDWRAWKERLGHAARSLHLMPSPT